MAVAMINDRGPTLGYLRFVFVSASGKLSFNRFATFVRDNEFTTAIGMSFRGRIDPNLILIDDIPPYKDVGRQKKKKISSYSEKYRIHIPLMLLQCRFLGILIFYGSN